MTIQDRNLEEKHCRSWFDANVGKSSLAGVFFETVTLTPAMAKVLLEANPANRTVKDTVIEKYAVDIANGQWALNGESIKISRDGFLNDGQHRCRAVIHAGMPIRTIVGFGFDRDSRLTLDQGAVRTPGDYLSMDGYQHARELAAVASLVWQYDLRASISRQGYFRPTKQQIQGFVGECALALTESIVAVPRKGSNKVGGHSLLAFCHFVFAKKDKGAADYFIKKLVVGDSLKTNDPIYVLRERLINDSRLRMEERAELIFRTWNSYRLGKKASIVKILGQLPKLER